MLLQGVARRWHYSPFLLSSHLGMSRQWWSLDWDAPPGLPECAEFLRAFSLENLKV